MLVVCSVEERRCQGLLRSAQRGRALALLFTALGLEAGTEQAWHVPIANITQDCQYADRGKSVAGDLHVVSLFAAERRI